MKRALKKLAKPAVAVGVGLLGAGVSHAADIALDDPTTTVTAAGTLAIAAVSVAAPLLLWLVGSRVVRKYVK